MVDGRAGSAEGLANLAIDWMVRKSIERTAEPERRRVAWVAHFLGISHLSARGWQQAAREMAVVGVGRMEGKIEVGGGQ